MRFYSLVVGFCIASFSTGAVDIYAQQSNAARSSTLRVVSPQLIEVYRSWQLAQIELRQYRFVELPRQRRWLDDQITLAEVQARELHRRVQDYRPALQFRSDNTPIRNAAENYRLELLATQQHLQRLKNQRIQLWRIAREEYRIRSLQVTVEATRFIALRNATALNPNTTASQAPNPQAIVKRKKLL